MTSILLALVMASAALRQTAQPQKPEVPELKANLGGECSTDFTIRDADGMPVYGALIHVRVRYGMMSVKRADLEVGTDSDGKARVTGLPDKARPLAYDVAKSGKKAVVVQDVARQCVATYVLVLK